ncbi:hypothetical protein QBC45DRAFT_392378 [Copromyces sp. CBS 386.78]|nr:hypothetical protein QBC45DRAFT_392378 [Copromyces sp. CBS 386.78]
MESSVFFKFKSNKEPTRVESVGTGMSVFELEREIILKSALDDGTLALVSSLPTETGHLSYFRGCEQRYCPQQQRTQVAGG